MQRQPTLCAQANTEASDDEIKKLVVIIFSEEAYKLAGQPRLP